MENVMPKNKTMFDSCEQVSSYLEKYCLSVCQDFCTSINVYQKAEEKSSIDVVTEILECLSAEDAVSVISNLKSVILLSEFCSRLRRQDFFIQSSIHDLNSMADFISYFITTFNLNNVNEKYLLEQWNSQRVLQLVACNKRREATKLWRSLERTETLFHPEDLRHIISCPPAVPTYLRYSAFLEEMRQLVATIMDKVKKPTVLELADKTGGSDMSKNHLEDTTTTQISFIDDSATGKTCYFERFSGAENNKKEHERAQILVKGPHNKKKKFDADRRVLEIRKKRRLNARNLEKNKNLALQSNDFDLEEEFNRYGNMEDMIIGIFCGGKKARVTYSRTDGEEIQLADKSDLLEEVEEEELDGKMGKNTICNGSKMSQILNNDLDLNTLKDSSKPEGEETQLADKNDVLEEVEEELDEKVEKNTMFNSRKMSQIKSNNFDLEEEFNRYGNMEDMIIGIFCGSKKTPVTYSRLEREKRQMADKSDLLEKVGEEELNGEVEKNTTFNRRRISQVKNKDFNLNTLMDSSRPEREEMQLVNKSDVFQEVDGSEGDNNLFHLRDYLPQSESTANNVSQYKKAASSWLLRIFKIH